MEQLQQQFNKHLNKVCRGIVGIQLRMASKEFFDDLISFFGEKKFTREDFDKIEVEGKVVEQDVVKTLFKENDEVGAGDIFVELFKTRVDKLFFGRKEKQLKGTLLGVVNSTSKEVNIRAQLPLKYVEKNGEVKAKLSKNMQDYFLTYDKIKKVVYHELMHIFESQSYLNDQIVKIGFKDHYLVKDVNGNSVFHGTKLNDKTYYEIRNFDNNQITLLKEVGSTALAESINDLRSLYIFCGGTDKEGEFTKEYCSSDFVRKVASISGTAYDYNFDISNLLNVVLDGKIFSRDILRTNQLIEMINKLKIDREVLGLACEKFRYQFKNPQDFDGLELCDNFTVLSVLMGGAQNLFNQSKNPDQIKTLVHSLLLNCFKNKIKDQLKDDKIEKNNKYFSDLNTKLWKIEKTTPYPNKKLVLLHHGENGYDKRELSYLDSVPISHMTKLMHMNEFADVLVTIDDGIKALPNGKDLWSSQNFLQCQNVKNLDLKRWTAEHNQILGEVQEEKRHNRQLASAQNLGLEK